MKVPLLDLKPHHEPIQAELLSAIARVLQSNVFILGPEIEALEESVATYSGTKFGIGVSSGTDALLVSLMALEIRAGDEVITSPFSFFATAGAIARTGAKPVFVDIDPKNFALDPMKLAAAIGPKTRAIVPVHLYGQCADMDPILEVASKHKLSVIEDAAQAIGAQYRNGKRAGSMGALGCFSFFPTKNLGGIGDGGMVVTNDQALADKVRMLRVHGSKVRYHHIAIGGNFRLDAIQAAVLRIKLRHLDRWSQKRRENAQRYRDLFSNKGLAEKIGITLPPALYEYSGFPQTHIYNQFVIRVSQRDALREHLNAHGVGSEVYYPVPFHLQECFQYLGYCEGDFPQSEKAAREVLALPIYPELSPQQQAFVVSTIAEFFGR